jgi:hypothetical protein
MSIFDACTAGVRRVSALQFFDRADLAPSSWGVVWWWERRRPMFNLVVGATGFLTSTAFLIGGLVSQSRLGEPIGLPDPPIAALFGIVIYGVMANVFYTGGWFVELLIRHVWGPPSKDFPRIAFTLGLLFSVAITLVPAGLEAIVVTVALVLGSNSGK